jgi:acetyl esterase/lipase
MVQIPQDTFDPTPYVHPELHCRIPQMQMQTSFRLTEQSLPILRESAAAWSIPALPQPVWREQMIPGPVNSPEVRLYVVNAGGSEDSKPAILHMHGGGFVIGSAVGDIYMLQEIAAALDCVIVSVDYRLAPETSFPGSLEDNYVGLKWLYANASELGVDLTRIEVMGGSAGGGHAAMLAIAARNRGEVPLVYQALISPMLDDRTGSICQKPPQQGALVWTPEHNRFGWSALLGISAGAAEVPDGAVPSRVENLQGLPPAFIGVGSIDLFVDENIEYARRLIEAGIPVTLNVVPGGFHGFDHSWYQPWRAI